MVARVEVYHPGIVAKNGEEVIGEGIKTYDLLDPTPENPTQNRLKLIKLPSGTHISIVTFQSWTEIYLNPDPGNWRKKVQQIIINGDLTKGPEYLTQHLLDVSGNTLATFTHIVAKNQELITD